MDSPHWSPDAQYIKTEGTDRTDRGLGRVPKSTLCIFDTKTQHWSTLYKGIFAYASFSSDSRYLYFLRPAGDPAILRVPVTGGEAKVVVGLKGFTFTGTIGLWLGLDPTDAPLLLRDVSTTDVYVLTLEEK